MLDKILLALYGGGICALFGAFLYAFADVVFSLISHYKTKREQKGVRK